MKKTLLASVAVLALMAATPVLADDVRGIGQNDHHAATADKGTKDTGATNGGGHHDQGTAGGGGSAGSGHAAGTGGSTGGSASGTGRTGGHIDHGNSDGNSGNGGSMSGSSMSQGSGGRHFGNTNGTKGAGSPANPLTGGSMMGGSNDHHNNDRGDRHNSNALDIFGIGGHGDKTKTAHGGSGGRHQDTTIIFGIGGHGYKNNSNFGHSRHNSAFDSFRKSVHASHRYRDGTYHRPSGWYEHTWNYGDFLPALFFADRYQIDDYNDFDLSDPPDGTVWVRYGNDALLVDDETGEIIQVDYGIFY